MKDGVIAATEPDASFGWYDEPPRMWKNRATQARSIVDSRLFGWAYRRAFHCDGCGTVLIPGRDDQDSSASDGDD
jgi:hypothetical protein